MSKSVLLKSSIAKKYWMALTGLFLCLFLVGHLLGNLQLFMDGEEGKRAFNEYAYFMAHNPAIKILSWLTYISILFHAVDGILLTIENKKARPVKYAYNNPGANSSFASRNMALLGSIVLIFIATHMANFWYKVKVSKADFPLHKVFLKQPQSSEETELYYTVNGTYLPVEAFTKPNPMTGKVEMSIKNNTEFYNTEFNLKMDEGYKDLHSLVYWFFGHDKEKEGFGKPNEYALFAVIFYVIAMAVLAFHLMHGFSSAFQSLGARHPKYTSTIEIAGKAFGIIIPLAFAIIPVYIFMTK